jgi:hypothetical protein
MSVVGGIFWDLEKALILSVMKYCLRWPTME